MLGPLCVGLSVMRVEDWCEGDAAPDLWALLADAVAPALNGSDGRITVADSKRLKASRSHTRGPMVHMERGVLAFMVACGAEVTDDASLFEILGARPETLPWSGGAGTALPRGMTADELAVVSNVLRGSMRRAGVEMLEMRCEMVGVEAFNETLRRCGSKGATTLGAIGRHLRHVLGRWGSSGDALRVVCDSLGARTRYARVLGELLKGAQVTALQENHRVSRYAVRTDGAEAVVSFMPEAESKHLPVALASMVAKLVRELTMERFNRYWCRRVPELKPTAGYVQDARRWLAEMDDVVTPTERAAMVRLA